MWAFGIQREIAPRTVLSIDYMGRRAYNLYGAYNANQPEIFRNGFLMRSRRAAGGESTLLDQLTRRIRAGLRPNRALPFFAVSFRPRFH